MHAPALTFLAIPKTIKSPKQRSKTAREAIDVMTTLVQEHGYASEGETFTIADAEEVWFMEMIGKGDFEKGAVWAAVQVPDGMVSAHANQARIRFLTEEDTLFAPDVVDFARYARATSSQSVK